MFTEEMRRDPQRFYKQLGPLFYDQARDLWMVLDYAGVKRALTDHETFSSNAAPARNVSFEWLLFMDPPRHEKLRAIILKAFTPRSIAALEPRIVEITRGLLQPLLARGEMDLCADFAAPLPMMVIAEMIGLPVEDWQKLTRWSHTLMNLASTIAGTAEASRAASQAFVAANQEMRGYFAALCQARRAEPRDDLITRLVAAELGEDELLRFLQLLLAAGTETTTNLIDNAVLSFVENPQQLARLTCDNLPQAIEEVLRYRSPGQIMFRATRREVELHGRRIPAGKMLLVGVGAANRDPAVFADPDRFDIGRDPNPHLAFGHGIHFCIGAPLARLEGRVALGELLFRLREIRITAPWQPRQAFHVHGPERLPIAFNGG
jgi:cytochrome P450